VDKLGLVLGIWGVGCWLGTVERLGSWLALGLAHYRGASSRRSRRLLWIDGQILSIWLSPSRKRAKERLNSKLGVLLGCSEGS
jgi:hypothetical protein